MLAEVKYYKGRNSLSHFFLLSALVGGLTHRPLFFEERRFITQEKGKQMRNQSKDDYKRITIELPIERYREMEVKAKELKTSRNKIVNAALAQYLNR